MKKAVVEFEITRYDKTKFRVYYANDFYIVEYRNDKRGVKNFEGVLVKKKWVELARQTYYADALDDLFEEARDHEAYNQSKEWT